MERRQAQTTQRRIEQTITVRVVYAEPSEDERAALEKGWAMLLGYPDDVQNGVPIPMERETPA